MDGQRFDKLTRALATSATRRGALGGFAVALLGLVRPGTTEAACTGYGRPCTAPTTCCNGAVCDGGACRCPAGSAVCNTTAGPACVTCPPGQIAAAGCRCACTSGRLCDGRCVNTVSDPANCGDCGYACASGQTCANGQCRGCPTGTVPCGGGCVGACAEGYALDGACRCLGRSGAACGGGGQCLSGHCADGVCCDQACCGQCEACSLAGSIGTCTAVAGAPVGDRPACASDGSVCGGACDGTHRDACAYPGADVACGERACVGATATLAAACDGQGACSPAATVDCSPYFCGETTCLTSCDGPEDCTSGFCVDGACCPGEDYCAYGDVCCDPDRSPTATCCPAANGGCCECFMSTDSGNEGPICCDPLKVCGAYPTDECCHYDEGCFNGGCVWEEKLCEGGVCPNKCCNGECCGPWDTCGPSGCEPLPSCTVENQETVCAGIGQCSPVGSGESGMVCCPYERLIDYSDAGAPPGTYGCCPFGEQPVQNGNPFTCCPGPNYCGTSRGKAARF